MAGEIKLKTGIVYAKSGQAYTLPDHVQNATGIDQAGQGFYSDTVSVGTSEQDLGHGGLTTPGWCYLKNLDPTNYLTYGPKSGGSMVLMGKLLPGEEAIFRLGASVTIRTIAHTAACELQILMFET